MAIELFLIQGSPYAWRVQLALEMKRVAYTVRTVSMSAGELRSPEYLAVNARGRVPALKDGDFTLGESLAILAYLDRRYPDPPLFGRTPEETGIIWEVASEYTSYMDHATEAFIVPLYFGKALAMREDVERAIGVLVPELERYEAALGRSPYLAGKGVTAADLVVFPHVQSILRASKKDGAKTFRLPFLPFADKCPSISAWIKRIEALPGYARTYPPNWR